MQKVSVPTDDNRLAKIRAAIATLGVAQNSVLLKSPDWQLHVSPDLLRKYHAIVTPVHLLKIIDELETLRNSRS